MPAEENCNERKVPPLSIRRIPGSPNPGEQSTQCSPKKRKVRTTSSQEDTFVMTILYCFVARSMVSETLNIDYNFFVGWMNGKTSVFRERTRHYTCVVNAIPFSWKNRAKGNTNVHSTSGNRNRMKSNYFFRVGFDEKFQVPHLTLFVFQVPEN